MENLGNDIKMIAMLDAAADEDGWAKLDNNYRIPCTGGRVAYRINSVTRWQARIYSRDEHGVLSRKHVYAAEENDEFI